MNIDSVSAIKQHYSKFICNNSDVSTLIEKYQSLTK